MANIAILGLGNWGTALARLWLEDGHNVFGWTVEQEVYESIMTEGMNRKYLDGQDLTGLDVTMRVKEALDASEIVVLALPSGVILDVVADIAYNFFSHPLLNRVRLEHLEEDLGLRNSF